METGTTNIVVSTNQAIVSNLLKNSTAQKAESAKSATTYQPSAAALTATVSISAYGKKINAMYEDLKAIKDPEAREQAQEGMRQVMTDMAGNGTDPAKMVDFMQTIGELQETDTAAFQDFFSTANTLKDGGYDMERWLDTFLELDDHGLEKSFMDRTNEIAASDSENNNENMVTFDEFIDGVREIIASGLEEEERNNLLDDFFDGLALKDNLAAKREFISDFADQVRSGQASEDSSSQ